VSFIHPALAATALGLLTLPILIHLWQRQRYRREPWAAMHFLYRAHRRSRGRLRLEQWLLLALRVAVLALFGLAVARPVLSIGIQKAAASAGAAQRSGVRVLVLDDSGSMRARHEDGRSAFEIAREAAIDLLDGFGPADGVSVILAGTLAEALIESPSFDHPTVRQHLTEVEPSDRTTDLAGALTMARRIALAASRPCTVYVLSDFISSDSLRARENGALLTLRNLREVAAVHGVSVTPSVRDNLAVTALVKTDPMVVCALPTGFAAEIANYGAPASREIQLEIRVDERPIRTVKVASVAPGAKRWVDFRVPFNRPGSQAVSVSISKGLEARQDALPQDNARHLSVEVRRGIRVLLVEPQGGATKFSGAFYLSHALAPRTDGVENRRDNPGGSSTSGGVHASSSGAFTPRRLGDAPGELDGLGTSDFAPIVLSASDLSATPLVDAAAVVLVDVGDLPANEWARLERYVRAGGGLWLIAGGATRADAINHVAAELLPARLEAPVEAEISAQVQWHTSRLEIADDVHPIAAALAGLRQGGLGTARFTNYWKTEPNAPGRVILNFDDGAPALLERVVGEGRVLLWTTSLDMSWNNFAAKPDFVPFVLNCIASLLPADPNSTGSGHDPPANSQMIATEAIRLRDTEGREWLLPPTVAESALHLPIETRGRDQPLQTPGAYVARTSERTWQVCVNVDPAESDLRSAVDPHDPEWLETITWLDRDDLGSGMRRERDRAAPTAISRLMFGAAFVLLLVETMLAAWYGQQGREK
jgi:hypothetical protein